MNARPVVVVGAGGRLGAALAKGLARGREVVRIARADLDLGKPGEVGRVLGDLDFSAAINCAALTNVDYCETHPEEADRVNAGAVRELAEVCAAKSARLLHISTDYVFAGHEDRLLRENDAAEPISVYGQSKLAGEREALRSSDNLAIRVSWVFGPERPSFIDMVLGKALKGEPIQAVADKFSSPTYTRDCVDWIEALLATPGATGLLHLCNSGKCSWREYGEVALDELRACGLAKESEGIAPLRLAEMKQFVAARPVHTAMDTARFTSLTGIVPRPWQEAVREYVRCEVVPRLTD